MCTFNSRALTSFTIILLGHAVISGHQINKVSRSNQARLMARVIGGRPAAEGDVPYQMHVQLIDLQFVGGATLVLASNGRQMAITAAHCITFPGTTMPIPPEIIEVRAGLVNRNETGQKLAVEKILVHPKYTTRTSEGVPQHDIAVLHLNGEFELGDNVKPIDLPVQGQEPTGGVKMSGWGATDASNIEALTEILQVVELPLVDPSVCSSWYTGGGSEQVIYDTTFCAGFEEVEKGGCRGDSGSPGVGVVNGDDVYLAGIVSWGDIQCQSPRHPTVFTKVSSYVDWIGEVSPSLP